MKQLIILLLIFTFFIAPCHASVVGAIKDFFGISHSDLIAAKEDGMSGEVSISETEAYNKVVEVLDSNDLKIYQQDRKEGYIIAMGFPKQNNTTRVGIFFEDLEKDKTKITLSSLSNSALINAYYLVFGNVG